jgi:hypothetical protein
VDSLPKHHPEHLSHLRDDTDARLPAAAYLRYEQRADGWSAGRQAACLAHLADNGVAVDAVRSVGMSPQGGYALRRQARGYAFNLGWEAALIIARRIVVDDVMTAAIKGETACWVREDGKTSYTRQNTKLSLTLLDRVNPATALPEVVAVATRFDCFLQMIDDGLSAQQLWDYFFDEVLAYEQLEARARVRAALQLSEESELFEGEGDDDIEYKSMEGAPLKRGDMGSHEDTKGLGYLAKPASHDNRAANPSVARMKCASRKRDIFVSLCEQNTTLAEASEASCLHFRGFLPSGSPSLGVTQVIPARKRAKVFHQGPCLTA